MTIDPPPTPRLIHKILLRYLLSYGPNTTPVELLQLNMLIGTNASGKSNFIEALALLRSAARDIRAEISAGGGIGEWIWKGAPNSSALLDVVVANPHGDQPLRHTLLFNALNQSFHLEDECIENEYADPGKDESSYYYKYQHGQPVIWANDAPRELAGASVEPDLSILAQRKDPERWAVITSLAERYAKIRIYRE